jgi:hypothetical protein
MVKEDQMGSQIGENPSSSRKRDAYAPTKREHKLIKKTGQKEEKKADLQISLSIPSSLFSHF